MIFIQPAIYFIISFSISQILGMFHPLQIMVFETMLNVKYPANATYLSTFISKFVNLDILDPDFLGEILFDYILSDVIH